MKVTRRTMIAGGITGALAVPTVAGLARWRWQHGGGAASLLYDDSLEAGRRFARAAHAADGEVRPITGDPVRIGKALTDRRPAIIAGVSRQADALLIGEVAEEAGYIRGVELRGRGSGCSGFHCDSGWKALSRFAVEAGAAWPEALAVWASDPAGNVFAPAAARSGRHDRETAIGWVLALA